MKADFTTGLCRLALLLALPAAIPAEMSLESAGHRLYATGQRIDGSPIEALVQGDVPLKGATAACSNCHRPSGLGTSEAGVRPLPITAAALFAPRTLVRPRPAYDRESLVAAITGGLGADGKPLGNQMPRYRLDAGELDALVGYLRTLGRDAGQGVTDTTITVATVVSADAPEVERQAVIEVMNRYVAIKNGGSRRELERAAAAKRHPYGHRDARAYRNWRLVVWQLSGAAAGWQDQLRELHERDSPFAVVSGTTGHDWQVVHDFCEVRHLPCLLPLSQAPDDAEHDFYSIYFSAGARLESGVAARHISASAKGDKARILVVREDSASGKTAFEDFLRAWQSRGGTRPMEALLPPETQPDEHFWVDAIQKSGPDAVLALLPEDRLAALAFGKARQALASRTLYTLDSFTDWRKAGKALLALPNLLHVYPYNIADGKRLAFPREELWLRAQGLGDLDVRLAGRVLFACHAFGEGLAGTLSNFSREYFIEELEHMLDGTSMTTLFPRTTFGPGQRVLTRGAFVISPSGLLSGTRAGAAWIDL